MIIIGKNSKVAKGFIEYCKNNSIELQKYSHTELDSINNSLDNQIGCIIFSISKKYKENNLIVEKMVNKNYSVLIISSASLLSKRYNNFKYGKIKFKQIQYALKYEKCLVGIFGSFTMIERVGKYYESNYKDILDAYNELISGVNGVKVYCRVKYDDENQEKDYYNLIEKIFGVKVTSLIYKIFTNKIYGYSKVDNE